MESIHGRFLYVCVCFVGKEILSLTDNLSQCLQNSSLSVAEGQEITKHVVTGLVDNRNDECFDLLWNEVMEKKSKDEAIAEFVKPRKSKIPSRYDSNGNEYFHSNPKLFYRQHYFDYVAGNIKERLDQLDYSLYIKLQNIILKASCCQDFSSELNSLEDLYKDEFKFFA